MTSRSCFASPRPAQSSGGSLSLQSPSPSWYRLSRTTGSIWVRIGLLLAIMGYASSLLGSHLHNGTRLTGAVTKFTINTSINRHGFLFVRSVHPNAAKRAQRHRQGHEGVPHPRRALGHGQHGYEADACQGPGDEGQVPGDKLVLRHRVLQQQPVTQGSGVCANCKGELNTAAVFAAAHA